MELNSLFWTPTLKILQIYHEQWIQLLEIIINILKYLDYKLPEETKRRGGTGEGEEEARQRRTWGQELDTQLPIGTGRNQAAGWGQKGGGVVQGIVKEGRKLKRRNHKGW